MWKTLFAASAAAPAGEPAGAAPPRGVAGHEVDSLIREGAKVWGRTPPIRMVPAQIQLFAQNSRADEAYLLLQGRIQLRRDNTLRRLPLEVLERGDWIGLGELLHKKPYVANAIALEASSLLVVSYSMAEQLFVQCPSLMMRALFGSARQVIHMIEAYEAQALDQTFLGLCRGVELILGQSGTLPESQLLARLRDLFALPVASLQEALKLLDGLNLLKRRQEPGREAFVSLNEPTNFSERVKSFSEQWRGRLPSLLGGEPPRDVYRLEEVCEMLEVKPAQLLRRMALPDFPAGLLRFDPDALETFRKTHGDTFFRKKVSGRELLAQIEAVDELLEVDVALLRDILPRMDVARLIRLLAGQNEKVRDHLLQALSNRSRKMVEEELRFISVPGMHELADLEDELLRLCRSA